MVGKAETAPSQRRRLDKSQQIREKQVDFAVCSSFPILGQELGQQPFN